jgi:transcriptional regulator with XRE-family HTH domain
MTLVGERIRQSRTFAGWTQEELAERLGVSPRTVQSWEGGTRFPGPRSQLKLASYFGKSPTYFREVW